MRGRILDLGLDNLHLAPAECLECVYWEMAEEMTPADVRFQKEEWFSSTLLEWGRCGKIVVEDDAGLAFAEYAPPTLFPRLSEFRSGDVSADAVYLSYCFVVEGHRGFGVGTELVRAVARDLVDRGFRAIESIGDRDWDGSWVLPAGFLAANGFGIVRDDPRYPLMRLDLRAGAASLERATGAAIPISEPS